MNHSPRADTLLDPAIRPGGMVSTENTIFITGATGFLGAQVLAELLLFTGHDVICLVRADSNALATQRIEAALGATGRVCPDMSARVTALRGDVAARNFGLDEASFAALARKTGQIIHCAAEVSWIKSYARLSGSHVNGTLNALRLACFGAAKPLHFISTLAVCYVPGGPEMVDESSDMSPHLEQIPLGYAQAKCVSETLLRQAAHRGLPVSILRCGLICGDSISGDSNHDDLISRLLRGAVQSGIAADVDWGLDCVPVNTVAQAVRTLAGDRHSGLRVLHLHHDEPRLWREMALWLRLNGYVVNLVALDEWLDMVGDHRSRRAPDLHVLRHFFLARPTAMGGCSLTELYLEQRRRCINSAVSFDYFERLNVRIPRLDAPLLNRYLARYQQQGFLPAHKTVRETRTDFSRAVEESLRDTLDAPVLELHEFRITPLSGSGLLSELYSLGSGGQSGLWRCFIEYRRVPDAAPEQRQGVLKIRATQNEQEAATLAVAALCSPSLAAAFQNHFPHLPNCHSLARETAIAASHDERLARYMPRSLATIVPGAGSHGGFVEEYLDDVELMDSAATPESWRDEHIVAAVRGLGQIHAVWYRREHELLQQPWLAPGADDFLSKQSLWRELAAFSGSRFGADISAIQHEIIGGLEHWQSQWVQMPLTLIHHDFNPRNLAFRRNAQGLALCAFDWELATIGLPQYDLAELLCFVLPETVCTNEIQRWLDLHRHHLAEASGIHIDQDEWQRGFNLALHQYLMCRLPLYAMMDRFKPQSYLSNVVANWLRLRHFANRHNDPEISDRITQTSIASDRPIRP